MDIAMDIDGALSLIRAIPDYPKPGILFQDISPMLADGPAFDAIITAFAKLDSHSDVVAGIEARGFILGSALAQKQRIGFVPIRKKGKLPAATFTRSYGLEYGSDEIEIHQDALLPGTSVTLVDDVLATGGTLEAAISLIRDAGGEISNVIVLLEISDLGGRERIAKIAPDLIIHSLVRT
jgi:adenine phosphoribosyltransferase